MSRFNGRFASYTNFILGIFIVNLLDFFSFVEAGRVMVTCWALSFFGLSMFCSALSSFFAIFLSSLICSLVSAGVMLFRTLAGDFLPADFDLF